MGIHIRNGVIYGGGGTGGTTDYTALQNLPSINSVQLLGDKTFADLGLGDVVTKNVDSVITQLDTSQNVPTTQAVATAINNWFTPLSQTINTFYIASTKTLMAEYVNGTVLIENNVPIANTYAKIATISSKRYKKNVENMTNECAEKLYDLRPVKFDYIDKQQGINQYGLIAEEVEKVVPSAVCYKDDKVEGLNYLKFLPQLIKLVQIQHKQIESLQKQLDSLILK